MKRAVLLSILFLLLTPVPFGAEEGVEDSVWSAERFKGLELRSLGPALMSGRIADIAIHPDDENLWYVAVGSGGVWKTENAGVTWTPVSQAI